MDSVDTSKVKVILLDIEGTTTPLDFVLEELFPYASDHVEEFLLRNQNEPEVSLLIQKLKELHSSHELEGQLPEVWNEASEVESAAKFVRFLISKDSKTPALKSLQGLIWKEGYSRGDLHGEVYPDVPDAMKRWNEQGIKICIYSSGSVLAQKQIFSTTAYGDLTTYISGFFDTKVGHKRDSQSYKNIANALEVGSDSILFLSDVAPEVESARKAMFQAILVIRDQLSDIQIKNLDFIRDFRGLL